MKSFTLRIDNIITETKDTKTFCFKQPGLKKINYLPGQYLTIVVTIDNRKYRRPYSFSSTFGIDNTLNITVKRVKEGLVSNYIFDKLFVGDVIEVLEPIGDFTFIAENVRENNIFLWGAGSGITPLFSILKAALFKQNKQVTLIYSSKSKSEMIFYKELLVLKNQFPNTLQMHLFCTREVNDDTLNSRINESVILDIISVTDTDNILHYICGPKELKDDIKNYLLKNGFQNNQILTEDFESNINPEELKDITTQFVKISNGIDLHEIKVTRGKSILEAILDYGLEVPYSCQTGNCKLCKGKLLSGEVKIINNEYNSDELDRDEYLLCCCYPLNENIIFKLK